MGLVLDRAGVRLTDARRAVLGLIDERPGGFTANDLVADARAQRVAVGRASVFRTVELLEDLSLVERLDLPSGEHTYVACEPAHHHHVVCSRCGKATEIANCGITAVARQVARRTGYQIDTHRLELFGLCPDCRMPRIR